MDSEDKEFLKLTLEQQRNLMAFQAIKMQRTLIDTLTNEFDQNMSIIELQNANLKMHSIFTEIHKSHCTQLNNLSPIMPDLSSILKTVQKSKKSKKEQVKQFLDMVSNNILIPIRNMLENSDDENSSDVEINLINNNVSERLTKTVQEDNETSIENQCLINDDNNNSSIIKDNDTSENPIIEFNENPLINIETVILDNEISLVNENGNKIEENNLVIDGDQNAPKMKRKRKPKENNFENVKKYKTRFAAREEFFLSLYNESKNSDIKDKNDEKNIENEQNIVNDNDQTIKKTNEDNIGVKTIDENHNINTKPKRIIKPKIIFDMNSPINVTKKMSKIRRKVTKVPLPKNTNSYKLRPKKIKKKT